jgi:hypothetical protein
MGVAVRLKFISRTSLTRLVDGRILVSYSKNTSKIAGLGSFQGGLYDFVRRNLGRMQKNINSQRL